MRLAECFTAARLTQHLSAPGRWRRIIGLGRTRAIVRVRDAWDLTHYSERTACHVLASAEPRPVAAGRVAVHDLLITYPADDFDARIEQPPRHLPPRNRSAHF
jgi:hypothetical protein